MARKRASLRRRLVLGHARADQRLQRGDQHGRLHRVHQVGVGPGVQAGHLVFVAHEGGRQVHHRQRATVASA
jgi:hypothetical protein